MGGKIYNVQLSSSSALATSTTSLAGYSKMQYYIDWANLLPPDKKFKLTFAMMSAISFGLNSNFPYITTNLLGHSYQPATNGFQNAYYLGHLRQTTTMSAVVANSTYVYSTYSADVNENTPIYLENRPVNNNLTVNILNNISNTEFTDAYATVIPGGTMMQTGFIITVQTFTAGVLTIGSVVTPTSLPARTITAFITGFGNVGLYLCNLSASVATGTGFTAPADTTAFGFPQYILNLSFEELA